MEEYKAKVIVQGETDGAVASLKNLKDETTKAKKATDELDRSQSSLSDKLDNLDNKFSSFAGTIGKVGNVLGAAGLVGMVGSAVAALGEMADHAAKVDGVNQGLKISLDEARKSTLGMVSDFNLASAANKAIQLGVVKNSQEFAKLAEVAGKLGMAMGQDVTQSVEDLTTGIGRQSFEILDNLGIMIKAEEAYDLYAQRIGKVASELTDAEKKQAFMTIALERAQEAADKSGVTLDTNVNRVQRVKAAWENFTDTLSVGFFNAAGGALELMDNLSARSSILEEIAKRQAEVAAQQEAMRKDMSENLNPIIAKGIEDAKSLLNLAGQEMKAAMAAEETYQRQQKALADTIIGPMPEKKKKGTSKKKEEKEIFATDRSVSLDASIGVTDEMIRAQNQEEYNLAYEMEISLREDNIQRLEEEVTLKQQQLDMNLIEAQDLEDVYSKKYQAEQDLLDFQIKASKDRSEIQDFEIQKRRRVAQESARINSISQQQELKSLEQKKQKYEHYGTAVTDVMGAVVIASLEAAEGEKYAVAKSVAAIAEGIRNQMILTSLKEFALAVASAASYNYPAAAQHATAGGLAVAAAAAAGGLAAGINASIPSQSSANSGGASSFGSGGNGGSRGMQSGSGGANQGGDDDGVPTSYYDADLWTKRPDKGGRGEERKGGGINISNVTVLGATKEEVGQAMDKLIRDSQRSLGRNTVRK